QDYLFKAVREAKVHTRWSQPNEPHENALRDFISGVLNREENSEFFADFGEFQKRTALYGMLNGLAQVLLKAACPGVADIYQGSELWDLRLVDPDNRGLVDFGKRISLFERLRGSQDSHSNSLHGIQELLRCWCDARIKLHVLSRALAARRENPALFLDGDYLPLETSGKHQERIVAFARKHEDGDAIAVVPRCVACIQAPVISRQRTDFWRDSILTIPEKSPEEWVNVLAGTHSSTISARGNRLTIGDVFGDFPIALLIPRDATNL
ncbi:MAG: malto-oligosyltrehalose synthase, partial [Candidatus Acidiferrales bacterium]